MGKLVQPIPIELDRPRNLVCDFNAFVAIKEWTGNNLFDGINPLGDPKIRPVNGAPDKTETVTIPDPVRLRATLAALLLHDDPAMTAPAAGRLITFENINDVMAKCGEAIAAFVGEAPNGANPTGGGDQGSSTQASTSSGPSAGTTSDSPTPSSGA